MYVRAKILSPVFNYVVSGKWFKEDTQAATQNTDDGQNSSKLKRTWWAIPALCIPVIIPCGLKKLSIRALHMWRKAIIF